MHIIIKENIPFGAFRAGPGRAWKDKLALTFISVLCKIDEHTYCYDLYGA